jgi:hypothetical protein
VIRVFGGQQRQSRAIEVDAVGVAQIRVAPGFAAGAAEIQHPVGFVDVIDRANHPVAPGDLILQDALLSVVEIEVIPPVAFRRPDHFAAAVEAARDEHRRAHERATGLVHDVAAGAGGGIDIAQSHVRVAALDLAIREALAIGGPIDAWSPVVQLRQRPCRHERLLTLRHVEDHQLRRRQVEINRQRIGVAEIFRPELILRRRQRHGQAREVALVHDVGRDPGRVG